MLIIDTKMFIMVILMILLYYCVVYYIEAWLFDACVFFLKDKSSSGSFVIRFSRFAENIGNNLIDRREKINRLIKSNRIKNSM